MATILLTGGGTAGHCTPNLALIPYLKKHFDKIYYIGSEHGIERKIIEKENIPYFYIPCAKLERSLTLKNLKIPFIVSKGIACANKIIDKIKPDIVFSKGGYVCIPTIIASAKRKIPIISHESDFTIGLANKIASKYSKKVLTCFPETAKSLKNGEYVGCPIRDELFTTNKKDSLKIFNFSGKKPILLVIGGSQGAKAINDNIRASLTDLLPRFDILHVCGKNNLITKQTPQGYYQTEFINNIENAYSIADVCVSRAGANSVFELMSLKIPCVLIPLPKTISRGDQIQNAEYFQKLGLVNVLPQEVLTQKSLTLAVNSVYANRLNVKRNFEAYPIGNACEKIVKIIVDNLSQKDC